MKARAYIATVVDQYGVPKKGFVLKVQDSGNLLYLDHESYALQQDMKMLDVSPLDLRSLVELSSPSEPVMGMQGILISRDGYGVIGPLMISSVMHRGIVCEVTGTTPSLEQHRFLVNEDYLFYKLPETRINLMKNLEKLILDPIGKTFDVRVDSMGDIVFENERYSQVNGLLKVMQKTGLTFDDALQVYSSAKDNGRCSFQSIPVEMPSLQVGAYKTAADDESSSTSKDTSNKRAQGESTRNSQATSKEQSDADIAQKSIEDKANEQFAQVQAMRNMQPVDFEDVQVVAKMNSPETMDSYLSGTLAGVNTAGKEQLMTISDDVTEAIKGIGKLLYKIRLGQVDTVKEEDAQMALNKLGDVSRGIGLAATELMLPPELGSDPNEFNEELRKTVPESGGVTNGSGIQNRF
jgi:hypothetical protein